jgi:hypothetical protein
MNSPGNKQNRRGSRTAPFINFIFLFGASRVVFIAAGEMNAGEKGAMRYLLSIAIMVFGVTAAITTAEAQTASDPTASGGTGVNSDPLSVTTSSLPTGSSFSTGSTGSSAAASNASGISASPSNTSQVPLQLSGETPSTSTQAATSTAAAAGHTSSTICPPSVPTSDGGSANLTDMVGGSLSGC